LNEFALARAIVDFERHSFVVWNPRFLEQTGYSEDEIKSAEPEELLAFGESWFPLSDKEGGQPVEFTSCVVRRPSEADRAAGHVVRSGGRIGYVMLDVSDSSAVQFEQGRIAGREEERNRIAKAYDEEVASSVIAALFLIETAKIELEQAGLPQAEVVSKASDKLAETTDKIAEVLSKVNGNPQA
jgi:PAS domain-containing protein